MKALFFAFLAFAVFFGTCFGVSFKADYVLRNRDAFPDGSVTGTLYYRYDASKLLDTIARFDTNYNDGSGIKVNKEIYHYKNAALYSYCWKCSASSLAATPEPWYHVDGDVEIGGNTYQRFGSSSADLVEFTVDSNNKPTYLKFVNGREYELSNLEDISFDSSYFNLPSDCPKPECHTFADIVFVLDNSASVDDTEWAQAKDFVQKVIDKFTLGPNAAAVGVVLFAAPYKGCTWYGACYQDGVDYESVRIKTACTKDSESKCNSKSAGKGYEWKYNRTTRECCYWGDRFLGDCKFEQMCTVNNNQYPYVKVPLELSYTSADVGKVSKIYGNTCQGYGLEMAYKMLFEDVNTRCRNGKCPTPMVIAVSDGDDLCRNRTTTAAKKLRDAGAYLFEVGVGLEADYDDEYIRSISTQIGTAASSLSVDNFAQMKTIIDSLVNQVCEFNVDPAASNCGVDCKGFCACGTCVCPSCSESDSQCSFFECDSNNAWNGCMVRDTSFSCMNKELEDTKCYRQWCDNAEGCKVEKLDCYQELEGKHNFKECESIQCVNGTGCHEQLIERNDTYCQTLEAAEGGCQIGRCAPDADGADPVTGCVYTPKDCSEPEHVHDCSVNECQNGECVFDGCIVETNCMKYNNETHKLEPICPVYGCMTVTCIEEGDMPDTERCVYTPIVCEESENMCLVNVCEYNEKNESKCVLRARKAEDNECLKENNECFTYSCDPSANDGHGACVSVMTEHETKPCYDYECKNETGWHASLKCVLDSKCKISMCIHDVVTGTDTCRVTDVSCVDKVSLPSDCFYPTCNEKDGCTIKRYSSSYYDICGNCVRTDIGANVSQQEMVNCVSVPDEGLEVEAISAAAIALIVLGAIIIGAALAGTSVLGTKALIDRARGATNQTAVSNPLFEDSQTEMANPAFVGQD